MLLARTEELQNPPRPISAEEIAKIKAAVPDKPIVNPARKRKLLVFTLCPGFKHRSMVYITKAFEIMGARTGAFEVTESKDLSVFEPENLAKFDGVCFNNTFRLEIEDAKLRKSLLDWVKSGKGVIAIHGAGGSFYKWPEGAEMIGGLLNSHPWYTEGTWAIKVDESDHPINAPFEGKSFLVTTEIYQFREPYSRNKLRVLLSLDMSDDRNWQVNRKQIHRNDKDFAVSWIHKVGAGRSFYCTLGCTKALFWNPKILRHYLAGIQFALGDLKVDTTPSGKLQPQAAARTK